MGRYRPTNLRTFTLPFTFTYFISGDACVDTDERLCAEQAEPTARFTVERARWSVAGRAARYRRHALWMSPLDAPRSLLTRSVTVPRQSPPRSRFQSTVRRQHRVVTVVRAELFFSSRFDFCWCTVAAELLTVEAVNRHIAGGGGKLVSCPNKFIWHFKIYLRRLYFQNVRSGVQTQKKFWSLRSQHCFVPHSQNSGTARYSDG